MNNIKNRLILELSDFDSLASRYDYSITRLKGLGILLMIIGHCTSLPFFLFNFIYSFHMPLFFICSGLFFKVRDCRGLFVSLLKKLFRPYVFYGLLTLGICIICSPTEIVKSRLEGLLFANGSPLYYPLFDIKLGLIGPIWFLMALFWCRLFYNFIYQKFNYTFIASIVIGIMAILLGRHVFALPLAILEGCSALVFYAIGVKLKSFDRIHLGKLGWGLFVCIFLFSCNFSSLRMSEFWYTLYPLDVISAVIGTYFCYCICKIISKGTISSVLTWYGSNSLLILCIHQLMLNIQDLLPLAYISGWVTITYNFMASTLITLIITKIKIKIS